MNTRLNQLLFSVEEIIKADNKVAKISSIIRLRGWELAQNIILMIIINLIPENSIVSI